MVAMHLEWLPEHEDWDGLLRSVKDLPAGEAAARLVELANCRMEFSQMGKLDRAFGRTVCACGGAVPGLERVNQQAVRPA